MIHARNLIKRVERELGGICYLLSHANLIKRVERLSG